MLPARNNTVFSGFPDARVIYLPVRAWFVAAGLIRLREFLSGCLESEAEIGKFRIPLNLIRLRPA